MTKHLLILSLLCNIVFAVVLHYQRGVIKTKDTQLVLNKTKRRFQPRSVSKVNNEIVQKKQVIKTTLSSVQKEDHPLSTIGLEESDFEEIAEEITTARDAYLAELDVSEEVLETKNALMLKFSKKVEKVYAQNPIGINMELKDRRKVIELEEKLYQELEDVFGKERWRQYKSFVDNYNKKALEASRESGSPNMLMGY